MQNELDNLIQLKQATIEAATGTTIPIVTIAVPSTLATSLAPATPLATTLPTTSATTSVTGSTTTTTHLSAEATKLIKATEDMSIQTK